MVSVGDLLVETQIADVEANCQALGWQFERVDERRFRVCLIARSGDRYQLEVECGGFPAEPAAFHWRNRESGSLDELVDAPAPYNFFFDSGRICAPWNRLASTPGGPHTEWQRAGWQHDTHTKGTVTLAAMVQRVHFELQSSDYHGRHK